MLDPSIGARWFSQLLDNVPWHGERREMYGRIVDVPRLTAAFRLDDSQAPALLRPMVESVRGCVDAPFNSVGLNLYGDGRDSVAPHNDHLDELVTGQPIALLSLGAAREMIIRAKAPPHRVLKLDLAAGSVLVMSHATQVHYDHGIPKQRARTGARISLAFRVRAAPHGQW